MVGIVNETLLIEAANFVPLGPWQVWFSGHGLAPNPTVKKNFLSTFCGTLAGNSSVAKLRSLFVKFVTKMVSLRDGSDGFNSGSFLLKEVGELRLKSSYSRTPAVVELSKVPRPETYGLAIMRKVAPGKDGLVRRRTLVVWPGAMMMVSVSKGLM